jgi:hypothetical protein
MTTLTPLSSSHPPALQYTIDPNTSLVFVHQSKQDILPTSQSSNLFDKNFQEFIHRIYHQRSRLTQLYDLEIQRRQVSPQLITFLNKIDQLLNEYENHKATNPPIGNPIQILLPNSLHFF